MLPPALRADPAWAELLLISYCGREVADPVTHVAVLTPQNQLALQRMPKPASGLCLLAWMPEWLCDTSFDGLVKANILPADCQAGTYAGATITTQGWGPCLGAVDWLVKRAGAIPLRAAARGCQHGDAGAPARAAAVS